MRDGISFDQLIVLFHNYFSPGGEQQNKVY